MKSAHLDIDRVGDMEGIAVDTGWVFVLLLGEGYRL